MEDDDRAMLDRQGAAEATLELDRDPRRGPTHRTRPRPTGAPAGSASSGASAGPRHSRREAGVDSSRRRSFADRRSCGRFAPDRKSRACWVSVLGEVDVTQDPLRDGYVAGLPMRRRPARRMPPRRRVVRGSLARYPCPVRTAAAYVATGRSLDTGASKPGSTRYSSVGVAGRSVGRCAVSERDS